MPRERVAVYVDGFNLYHSICDLDKPHLKWVNIRKLAQLLLKPRSQKLVLVRYFSAYANHFSGTPKADSLVRHRAYVKCLEAKGVTAHMGNFAKRDFHYSGGNKYKARWRRHEEKQTDVGIGVNLIHDAHSDIFDRALVISVDTDMLPVFALMREHFPAKPIVCVAPPHRGHHRTIQLAGVELDAIKVSQIERSLFGATVVCGGALVARRPPSYRPPT